MGHNEVRFHDLRHEAISRLFEKGLTVPGGKHMVTNPPNALDMLIVM